MKKVRWYHHFQHALPKRLQQTSGWAARCATVLFLMLRLLQRMSRSAEEAKPAAFLSPPIFYSVYVDCLITCSLAVLMLDTINTMMTSLLFQVAIPSFSIFLSFFNKVLRL